MPRTVTYWSAVALELKGSPAFEVHNLSGREALAQAERLLGKRYLELTHALPPDLVTLWTEDTGPAGA